MADKKETETKKSKFEGIPMTEEGLKEYEQDWKDIDDSIKLVMKNGKNL